MSKTFTESALPTYIARFLVSKFGEDIVNCSKVKEMKSAQQQAWILSNVPNAENWNEALRVANQHLVVRCWKGSSRWWNLNNNDSSGIKLLALAELSGYKVARSALNSDTLLIPEVLYESLDDEFPWAIFTYVGHHSNYFHETKVPDNYWFESMVMFRHEFGFEEPHPRWGRVPSTEAQDYAMDVLMTVTIPLHRYIDTQRDGLDWSNLDNGMEGITYHDMAFFYMAALECMIDNTDNVVKATTLKRVLGHCIEELQLESVPGLPPVLCHMDCQPQNLIFYKERDGKPRIHSVLDWEEAAYADPRFELLMLARKVCANREQADVIWKTYQDEVDVDLGDIESWLKLETVHSITTLVLQNQNLLGGGRNPWESKPDLEHKIKREFSRLVGLGWEFCNELGTEQLSP